MNVEFKHLKKNTFNKLRKISLKSIKTEKNIKFSQKSIVYLGDVEKIWVVDS